MVACCHKSCFPRPWVWLLCLAEVKYKDLNPKAEYFWRVRGWIINILS